MSLSRRRALSLAGASFVAAPFIRPSWAQSAGPLKVGVMLPYSGTYAQLGRAITQGMELYLKQKGGSLVGRAITLVKLDDEAEPSKATDNTNKLVYGEKVDVLTGTVHSGVALAMTKIAREAGLPTLITNAGANDITGSLCAPNIFRSSFGNSQVGAATGMAAAKAGIKDAVTFTWRYAAGAESVAGFAETFTAAGGKIIKDIAVPFPDVEFQSALAEIASLKPSAVYAFFAGGGAAKFIKDYAGAKLNDSIPLWGPGFLTDGVEQAVGPAGDGIKTALHYVETLDNPENKAFRGAYKDAFNADADVYAVQGYDAMALLDIGLKATGGDVAKKDALFAAIASASFNSPRGPFKLSASHNPIQNFYLRELRGGVNKYLGMAAANLAENSKGCRMAS